MANRLLEVSANSNGYLQIHFDRKYLKSGQSLMYAQIFSCVDGLEIGQPYNPNLHTLVADAAVDGQTPAPLDFSHAAACKAANDAIVERNMALHKAITPGVGPIPDVGVDYDAAAAPPTIVSSLLTLPTTNGGTFSSGLPVCYPTRYWIVGYDNKKLITFISKNPCRDPSDVYFELLSKDGKFVLGWDNEHCFYSGYIALYNYEPKLGSNIADLKGYKAYQWTTKGSSYNTGVADDGKQWYAALCTYDYSIKDWTILRVMGVVESVEVYDLKYDDVTKNTITTTDQQVFTVDATNSSDSPITTNCTQSFSLEQSYSWTSAWSLKVGVSVRYETGIPYVVSEETTVHIEGSKTWESTTVNTTTQTVTVLQSITVEPRSKNVVKFESFVGGVTNLKFHAKTRTTCRGGEQFGSSTRDVTGEYTGAVSNRIGVDVGPTEPLPTTNPAAVAVEEAQPQQIAAQTSAVAKDVSQQVFAVEADTIYWYYVDENGQLHPTSTGI